MLWFKQDAPEGREHPQACGKAASICDDGRLLEGSHRVLMLVRIAVDDPRAIMVLGFIDLVLVCAMHINPFMGSKETTVNTLLHAPTP